MGSAVSAVTGAVSSVIGGVAGGAGSVVGSVASPILGAGGQAVGAGLGALASGIISQIPDIPIANQQAVQSQINQNVQNAASYNNQASQLQRQAESSILPQTFNSINQADRNIQQAQNAIGQGQGAVENAQNVNQGQGSNVNQAIGLVGQTAAGGGAAQQAANATLQQGTNQALAGQQAIANSGNLSQMISGQKTALDNAAQIQQQNALNASQLQAGLATTAQGQYTGAAAQQAGQAAQNASLQQQQTAQQQAQTAAQQQQTAQNTNLYQANLNAGLGYTGAANTAQGNALTGQTNALGIQQQALGQTGQNKAMAVGGVLNAAGGAASGLLGSDEDSKTDIKPVTREAKSKAISDSFGYKPKEESESKPDEDQKPEEKPREYWGDSGSQAASESISASFSDKNGKNDIKKDDKVSKFLDAIDPVSFKYKEPDGQMGKTPGEHLGVIAQQVEKAPGGKSMVIETPKGKAIDLASAVGTLMAAAAETHDRVKELEAMFESKRKGKK